ncbi:MAG: MBL fold metallo-hydrolase [Candidatus Aminicenantes bacterium]|nr:MBL fold metallo-hydrolase [Candidatus Aminicenantes bacterium]
MKKQCTCWLGLILFLSLTGLAFSGEAGQDVKAVSISEKIYLISGLSGAGNVVFLVAGQGVLVVDSGASPADGLIIVEKIRSVTDRPIRYVVLTHSHGDHVFGLQSFPPGTLIIAQQNLTKNMQRDDDEIKDNLVKLPARITALKEKIALLGKKQKTLRLTEEESLKKLEGQYAFYKELQLVRPQITLDNGKMTISLGGETVEIINPGPAHIDDNLLVYFPGQKVVHMGDMLFYRHHPYIDWQAGSNTATWIAALRDVQTWPVEKVIPGHGPVAGKEALDEQIRYLSDLRAAVASGLKNGHTLEQMKKSIVLPAWKDLGFPNMLPYAVEAVYHELSRD